MAGVSGRSFLTVGRCSEVVVSTGVTVDLNGNRYIFHEIDDSKNDCYALKAVQTYLNLGMTFSH